MNLVTDGTEVRTDGIRVPQSVLVTGGGGYIGSVLVPLLLSKGYKVKVLDRFFFGNAGLPESPNLELINGDIRILEENIFESVDHVIDLAAISNDPSGELFQQATWAINSRARTNLAQMAKKAGVRKYIFPSSCSVYGFQEDGVIAAESSVENPLTTYAKANLEGEGVLRFASPEFCVVVIRQATVYGLSPRMRFDLAINGMTYGAWKTGKLPLMRDGSQWRPMVHVIDTCRAMCMMLEMDPTRINGEIFNVGSEDNNYQLGDLANRLVECIDKNIEIEWYGDPDERSYRVSFEKIEKLGFVRNYVAEDGVNEIIRALEQGTTDKTQKTITLDWYQELSRWHNLIKDVTIDGNLIELPND